jgi:hypothetical protein
VLHAAPALRPPATSGPPHCPVQGLDKLVSAIVAEHSSRVCGLVDFELDSISCSWHSKCNSAALDSSDPSSHDWRTWGASGATGLTRACLLPPTPSDCHWASLQRDTATATPQSHRCAKGGAGSGAGTSHRRSPPAGGRPGYGERASCSPISRQGRRAVPACAQWARRSKVHRNSAGRPHADIRVAVRAILQWELCFLAQRMRSSVYGRASGNVVTRLEGLCAEWVCDAHREAALCGLLWSNCGIILGLLQDGDENAPTAAALAPDAVHPHVTAAAQLRGLGCVRDVMPLRSLREIDTGQRRYVAFTACGWSGPTPEEGERAAHVESAGCTPWSVLPGTSGPQVPHPNSDQARGGAPCSQLNASASAAAPSFWSADGSVGGDSVHPGAFVLHDGCTQSLYTQGTAICAPKSPVPTPVKDTISRNLFGA